MPTFALAALVWLICALRLMDSAMPAGSSEGETIFEPEDRRANDSFKLLVDRLRLFAAVWAAMFVLITILTLSVSYPLRGFYCHDIPVVERIFFRASAAFPIGLLWPPIASCRQSGVSVNWGKTLAAHDGKNLNRGCEKDKNPGRLGGRLGLWETELGA